MSDDETKNESAEQEPQDEAPQDEAPQAEPADAAADAESSDSGDAGAGEGSGAEADELAELPWKERQRLLRSRQPHEPRPARTPEERAAERKERRKRKAAERRKERAAARAAKKPGTGTPPVKRESNAPKVRQGVVVSDKGDKSITVKIEIARRHRTYEKIVRRSRTLHAHDERNEASEGDVVRVVETRPLSKTKRWRLIDIVEKAR